MEWIIIHNDHSAEFPNHLTLEEKIEYRRIKVERLLEKIKQKYPNMRVILANVLGSRVDLPYDIYADEFQTEFDCRIQ